MLIYVLSRDESLYSTKRLVEAGIAKGWDIQVIDYLKCSIEILKGELKVNYNGSQLTTPDAIIPRIGASRTFYGTAMVRHFEIIGAFSTSGNLAIQRSRDNKCSKRKCYAA
jgi:ribosomal protein S6--L-glutamate ligase